MVIFSPWRFFDVNDRVVVFFEKDRSLETDFTTSRAPGGDLAIFENIWKLLPLLQHLKPTCARNMLTLYW